MVLNEWLENNGMRTDVVRNGRTAFCNTQFCFHKICKHEAKYVLYFLNYSNVGTRAEYLNKMAPTFVYLCTCFALIILMHKMLNRIVDGY
jgi:hypothetical protein